MNLKICIDIDDTIASWRSEYIKIFGIPKSDSEISKNIVNKLQYNKDFWLSLPVLEEINFEPAIYCTKRLNNKSWTKKWLLNNGFPKKPVYQMVNQYGNKATVIKGRCDVLIDDSEFNCYQALEVGFPAILITRPHNVNSNYPYRINKLDLDEITFVYNQIYETI